ncbi:shikimate kinase [Serinibacter arcticus]|uniref:Shikimate kinase n=2 Tax=Serinibacter arcticus TaxID=1655435 RepID=A0A2U1ZZ81_9MICO|nr:shikimate kinase [Serinibacter arcticus]
MGSGKSAVGRRLATRIGLPFRDVDADVEASAGRTIAEIFASDGEAHFRDLEHDAVARALTEHPGVLSLGGGAVMDPRTQSVLADYRADGGLVVLLDVSLRYAMHRIGSAASRPMLADDPRERWTRILAARRPTYERVSNLVVDTDQRTLGAVVREIAARLGVDEAASPDEGC